MRSDDAEAQKPWLLMHERSSLLPASVNFTHHSTSFIQTSNTFTNKYSYHFVTVSCSLYQVSTSSVTQMAPRKRARRSRRYPEQPLSQSTPYFSRDRTLGSSTPSNSAPYTPAIATTTPRATPASPSAQPFDLPDYNARPAPSGSPKYAEDNFATRSEPIEDNNINHSGSSEDEFEHLMRQEAFDVFHPDSDEELAPSQPLPPQRSNDSTDLLVIAVRLVADLKSFMKRTAFLAIISLYEKVRYTLDHYDHLVALMKDGGSVNVLPSSTTMRQKIFPSLLSRFFVPSTIESFSSKKGVCNHIKRNDSTITSQRMERQNEAVVVLPSDWAKMDIRTLPVLRELICLNHCRC